MKIQLANSLPKSVTRKKRGCADLILNSSQLKNYNAELAICQLLNGRKPVSEDWNTHDFLGVLPHLITGIHLSIDRICHD